ncbi:hypothetical protein HHI36_010646 [Cryptolaemus montrouzieri]|uniref:EF-hand domain-containing protein n=1 Tax=Cryptolaemus montrouzieri TaxID=559131 RepID=A0ABD2MJA5_9CUCU
MENDTSRNASSIQFISTLSSIFQVYTKPFRMKFKITKEQKEDLLEAFNLLDLDGDGKVTNLELRVAIRALGFEVKPEDIKKLKESANICVGVDILSFQNFVDLMEVKMIQPDDSEEITKYFNLIDYDNTGKINFKKLRKVARILGEEVTDEILHEMLSEVQTEDITVEELIRFIRNSMIKLQELYNKK